MNRLVCTSIFAVFVCGAAMLVGGPLNPPGGPVASTYKTLTEVEPRIAIGSANTPGDANSLFRIAQPGSYYLTGNITGVAGKHGIEIAASNVTIDLMGFTLQGVGTALDGINAPAGTTDRLTIRNGVVSNWGGGDGIEALATGVTVESVRSANNGGIGISIGEGGVVLGCTASFNGSMGISVDASGSVRDCTASGNFGDGIRVYSTSTVTGCTADSNFLRGIEARLASGVTNCTAKSNGSGGIFVSDGSTASGCTSRDNSVIGIHARYSTVTACTAHDNLGGGINAEISSIVTGCSANRNSGVGITADISIVSGCYAVLNGSDGLVLGSDCRAIGNECHRNAIGIHATGGNNHIENNTCTLNGFGGITVDGGGNFIVRNACSNSADYTIAGGNDAGTIVGTPVGAGAWDNFRY